MFEPGANRVGVVTDASQVGVIGEQLTDHRGGEAELITVKQVSQDVQQVTHGSKSS